MSGAGAAAGAGAGAGPTVADLLRRREHDDGPGLRFEEHTWTWAEHVAEARARAAWLHRVRDPGRPFHVGVLLDNVPEFSVLLGAAALGGAVVVGLNPTRRGAALARDVRHADCQLVVTESRHAGLLDGLDLGVSPHRVYDVDSADWVPSLRSGNVAGVPSADRFVAGDPRDVRGAPDRGGPDRGGPGPDDLLMLIFTSGTDGEPKAVQCTHRKMAEPGLMLAERMGLTGDDCAYVSMPLFHSNAVMAGWAVALAAGATLALRRSFSASGFLPDVRRFGATYANYVGKPLSYVLATPQRPDDAHNPLRIVYGNEGAEPDLEEFARRFGCHVVDGFGSTEGGVAVSRVPGSPPGSLGVAADGVRVLDPATGRECPDARFEHGVLANPDEAVGELVNTTGPGAFAGYYRQPDADAARMRDGMYWSGDLAYRDADGYLYFAGRAGEWLRVDGENLGTAPIERLLLRHEPVGQVAVYAVPDPVVGDQVMAAVVPRDGAGFDPDAFGAFLAAQPDLGTKQAPRYVRVCADLPRGRTYKVLKRDLAAQGLDVPDPVWVRDGAGLGYRRLTAAEAARP